MSRIAPKPIIAQVAQTWRLPTGLTFALVRDIESQIWIVESCPAGTHFWTLEQAAQLPQGRQTGFIIQAALRRAKEWSAAIPAAEPSAFDYTLTDSVRKLLEAPAAEKPESSLRFRALAKKSVCA